MSLSLSAAWGMLGKWVIVMGKDCCWYTLIMQRGSTGGNTMGCLRLSAWFGEICVCFLSGWHYHLLGQYLSLAAVQWHLTWHRGRPSVQPTRCQSPSPSVFNLTTAFAFELPTDKLQCWKENPTFQLFHGDIICSLLFMYAVLFWLLDSVNKIHGVTSCMMTGLTCHSKFYQCKKCFADDRPYVNSPFFVP